MFDFIKNTVLRPGLERLGTVGASLLLFGGDWLCRNWEACGLVTESGAHQVMTYLIAVAMLVTELGYIHAKRKGWVK